MRRFILILILALGLAVPAAAGKPPSQEPLHFDDFGLVQHGGSVEQQSDTFTNDPAHDVWNATLYDADPRWCTWDVDDRWTRLAANDWLDAHTYATDTQCVIAESTAIWKYSQGVAGWHGNNSARPLVVDVTAPSANLLVSVCYQSVTLSQCFAIPPVANGSVYNYRWCADIRFPMVRYWQEPEHVLITEYPPEMQPIAGSNGGRGQLVDQTIIVSNPTNSRVRNITANFTQFPVIWDPPVWCQPDPVVNGDPFDIYFP